jgi:hypothetical protein
MHIPISMLCWLLIAVCYCDAHTKVFKWRLKSWWWWWLMMLRNN